MTTTHADAGSDDFIAALHSKGLLPLWQEFHKVAAREPTPKDQAMHWAWQALTPLIDASISAVDMHDAERRALVLANPEFDGKMITTGAMNGAIQIIAPGESADPHRHTAAAIRFVIESEGAVTSVNGEGCEMRPGDLILTPAWTWHGHVNHTGSRAIWFDGLDVPLVRFDTDAFFYEPGRNIAPPNATKMSDGELAWGEAGMVSTAPPVAAMYSPKFHYGWDSAQRSVRAVAPRPDGSQLLRYANPLTGGSVMPTIDCYLMRLQDHQQTQARRSTFNTMCVVASGEGRSTIGDKSFDWKKNDIFTIPHWRWATHTATSKEAMIFQMTDREVYARLDLLREECQ